MLKNNKKLLVGINFIVSFADVQTKKEENMMNIPVEGNKHGHHPMHMMQEPLNLGRNGEH